MKAHGRAPRPQSPRSRDVDAERAEALGERALDHVDAVCQSLALAQAPAARALEADGMDLVDMGHGVVAFRQFHDLGDRRDVRDVAVH